MRNLFGAVVLAVVSYVAVKPTDKILNKLNI